MSKQDNYEVYPLIDLSEATVESQQKRIEKLQAENHDLKSRIRTMETAVMAELEQMVSVYESRLAYLMANHTGGFLRDEDIEKWGKDKVYAIIAEDSDNGLVWKVVVEDGRKEKAVAGRPNEHARSQ